MTLHNKLVADENINTVANYITLFRAVLCTSVFVIAFLQRNHILNIWGLVIYWVLDNIDGSLARWLNQETILGAQIDIFSDRLLIVLFYINYLSASPANVLLVILFLFEFVFIDGYLSMQFMHWNIVSPNYFYKVHKTIWLWNWSLPAKALNSGAVSVMLIMNQTSLAITIVVVLFFIKIISFVGVQVVIHRS